jgi:hypothetical protein
MGLPPFKSAVFLITNKFWENMGVSEEYLRWLCDRVSGMYVCMLRKKTARKN